MAPLPPGYAEVVRAHHAKTIGYLCPLGPQAAHLATTEIQRVRRNLRRLEVEELDSFRPRGSWMLAILIGRRDDASKVVGWAKDSEAPDLERVFIYYLAGADILEILRPWTDADLPSPVVSEIRDFSSFHKVFGKHLNDRVWLDHS